MNNNGHNIEKTNFDAFINAVGSEIQQAQVRLITAAIQSPNQKIPDRKTKCDFLCKIKACLIIV